MTTTKTILYTGAATLLVLALFGGKAPAKAYDQWNGSGFATNHHYYGRSLGGGGAQVITMPYADEAAAREKAIHDQRICAPVVLWTDEGRVVHPAMGCRR